MSKCISKNEMDTFRLHDAGITKTTIENNTLIMHTNGICISTDNSQNNEPFDTIADDMIIRFYNYKFLKLENQNGRGKTTVLTIDKKKIFNILNNVASVAYGGYDNDDYVIELFDSDNNFYSLTFHFEKMVAEWEYTSDKAWYVR